MTFRHLLRTLLPPRRPRGVAAMSWWHPAVFLALFVVAVISVEAFEIALFASPAFLALVLVAPWLWWLASAGWHGLPRRRAALALWTRYVLLAALAVVLAEPHAVRSSRDLALVYVLDVSDSMNDDFVARANAWIGESVAGKPREDHVGMVMFGRDAGVRLPVRQTFPMESYDVVEVDEGGTDIAGALSLAGALLDDDRPGRIVLISDGVHHGEPVLPEAERLAARGIPVDVITDSYSLAHEVWVEKLELPDEVKAGETYELSVVLSALTKGTGRLVLRENGEVLDHLTRDVRYDAGKNRYRLPLYLRGPGYYEYTATIEPPPQRDYWEKNNTAIASLHLEGEGRVLVAIAGAAAEPRDHQAFVRALLDADRQVEVIDALALPRDPLSFMPYDSVVLCNVPADMVDEVQQRAVHDAVYNLGTGLLMVGGEHGFGAGGWKGTEVEKALPVDMDVKSKKFLPKGALAIVLHTCEFAGGNAWAKKITKKAIKVLSARDDVGVLVFNWGGGGVQGVRWLFRLQPAGNYNRLAALINGASPGDMPSFAPTMQLALNGLVANNAASKHMIIISDGDPSPPAPQVVQGFVKNQISISTITINPHGAPPPIMQNLAKATGGRHYYPRNPNQLPAIFIKEAKTLRRSLIQNREVLPEVAYPSPVLKGIETLPVQEGYVLTTLKGERAYNVLQVEGSEEGEYDPLLSFWRYGVGKSAAFTGDLGGNWGKRWLRWASYKSFVEQLMTRIARGRSDTHLQVEVHDHQGRGVIEIEDHHPDGGFLDVKAKVVNPEGEERSVEVESVGPGRYQAEFPLEGLGRYQVMVAGTGGDRKERTVAGLAIPYAREYTRFDADPQALLRIADRTGGRELDFNTGGEELFGVDRQRRSTSQPIFDWLLLLLACLIPLDVAIRRLQIDWAALAARLALRRRGKGEAANETMGRLMARKKELVFDEREEEGPETGAAQTGATGESRKPKATEDDAKKRIAPEDMGDELSTTAKLLEMRKKKKR